MKHSSQFVAVMVLLAGSCMAQNQAVPPPPMPADEGPSLDVTLKFIQEKLQEQGSVHYAVYIRDNNSGQESLSTNSPQSIEITSFAPDSANCKFAEQDKVTANNSTFTITAARPLKPIRQVQVMPASAWWTQELADEGSPTQTARIEPPFFILSRGRAQKGINCIKDGKTVPCQDPTWTDRLNMTWAFRDEETADRVAKALTHAVELCGGGAAPEPF